MKTITVNGNEINWEKDINIDDLLKKMNYTFKMIVVKIDGNLIKKNEYKSTIVYAGADVKVIHLVSGG
ncbi:MAG: sulfur carrier protein ThiS [Candidatus Cloacimonetes bacterium]|nr:sulfur carrier protein ThiS [Candidatus Cloacimonadota bacterium]